MKYAVLTLAIGEHYTKMGEITHPIIQAYADRIGADFIIVRESKCSTPHWQKLIEIQKVLIQYDRVLYIDTDIIIRNDCPSLFDIVPVEKIGMFNEASFTNRSQELLIDTCKTYGVTLPTWDGRYFNTGVMVISKRHRSLFEKPDIENCSFYEQTYLNMIFAKETPDIYELKYHFNRMTCVDMPTGEERFASYIIHYAGYPSLAHVLDLIPKDIEKWKKDAGKYKYKEHVCINITGGIGDQICAEPALRWALENLYYNDDVNIIADWPRMLDHLKEYGGKVWARGEFKPQNDTPYYHMVSLPPPKQNSLTWAVVSNLMCHTVDFCSISMLRRTLPTKNKQIRLNVNDSNFEELEELLGTSDFTEYILVHPGRHWRTKTFPISWWQDIINKLAASHPGKICLVGKNDEATRGTVDVDCPEGVIDLRDLLSLSGLIALISKARVLISNDSAPIHIAGAFDNYIVLIPSCKHPDHILPYRNGNIYYKAAALYKRVAIDDVRSKPNTVYEVVGDFDVKDWNRYLPDTLEVVEKTLEFYNANNLVVV